LQPPPHTVILGASPKPDRYAYKAHQKLLAQAHSVLPVSPTGATILETPGFSTIAEITQPIDTVTLYLSPKRLEPILPELIAAQPRRVIFNPGTESSLAQQQLREAGIPFIEACTLVLLATGDY